MPVHNAASYLPAAVGSILGQTFRDFELIAVDDGSTDNSLDILRQLAAGDSRIRVITRPGTGIVGALNDGLAAARGELIARMDADDVALPRRFERQVAFLRGKPDCVAVGSAVLLIDSDGDPICVQTWAETHEEIDSLLLRGHGGLAHPTAMMRTAALRHVGGYRKQYEWIEDKDLWLRLAEIGRLANLLDPLLQYRLHGTSVCAQREREQQRLWEQLLAETYQRRRLAAKPPKLHLPRHAAVGDHCARAKWIRGAARSGNYRTAAKHARRLAKEYPLRPSTWMTILRAALATLKSRRAA
jgi:glycosyltransferase involved in cell wall biosynthesis